MEFLVTYAAEASIIIMESIQERSIQVVAVGSLPVHEQPFVRLLCHERIFRSVLLIPKNVMEFLLTFFCKIEVPVEDHVLYFFVIFFQAYHILNLFIE